MALTCKEVELLWLQLLSLSRCRGLVPGLQKQDCGLNPRIGFADEGAEVAGERLGEVIHSLLLVC
jgi:hypothetical protein